MCAVCIITSVLFVKQLKELLVPISPNLTRRNELANVDPIYERAEATSISFNTSEYKDKTVKVMDDCSAGVVSPEKKAVETELETNGRIEQTTENISDQDLANCELQYHNSP